MAMSSERCSRNSRLPVVTITLATFLRIGVDTGSTVMIIAQAFRAGKCAKACPGRENRESWTGSGDGECDALHEQPRGAKGFLEAGATESAQILRIRPAPLTGGVGTGMRVTRARPCVAGSAGQCRFGGSAAFADAQPPAALSRPEVHAVPMPESAMTGGTGHRRRGSDRFLPGWGAGRGRSSRAGHRTAGVPNFADRSWLVQASPMAGR